MGSRGHALDYALGHGQAADTLACAVCSRPRAKTGGGTALALLDLRWGQAADALACAARLQPNAKRWGGSVVGRLDMYRTKVLLYRTMVLLARPTKVRC